MNNMTIARSRQLEWLLEELLGGRTAAIRPRLLATRSRARSPAAALFAAAVGIVFGVAWFAGDATDEPRRPATVKITWHEAHGVADLASLPGDIESLRCFDFDDAAIAELPRFEDLVRLDLSGMDVNDKGYAISLKISDDGLAPLQQLTKLRWLSLAGCHRIEGRGLQVLESLPRLEHLDLTFTNVRSPAVERLPRLPSLRELSLASCMMFEGRSLEHIARIPGLRRLELRGCTTLTAADVVHLAALHELRYLDLRDCQGRFRGQRMVIADDPENPEPPQPHEDGIGVTDAAVAALAKLRLETLLLGGCTSLTDAMAPTLSSWSSLRELDLGRLPKITDKLLARLPAKLVALGLDGNTHLGDAAMRALPPLPGLRELGLSALLALTDDGLRTALEGRSLRVLRIGGQDPRRLPGGGEIEIPKLTSACRVEIAKQRELEKLELGGWTEWVDASVLGEVAALPSLRELDLSASVRLTDEALSALGSSRSIATLTLVQCDRVTRAGLKNLQDVPLESLDLYGMKVTTEEARTLAVSWPGVTVRLRDGQMLRR